MTIYRAQRCPEHERRGIPAGRPHSRQKLLCYSGRTFPDQQPNIQKPKRAIETETKSGGAIEKPMDEIGTDLYIKEASAKDMRPDVVTEMHNDMNKLHQCSAEETDRPLLMNKEILEATNDTSSIRSKPPQVKKSRDKNVCLTISTKINPITCKGKRKEKRTRQIVRLWLRCKLAHGQR